MKQISDQAFKDIASILPLLAQVADGSDSKKVANAGRLARKYGKMFNRKKE